MLQMLLERGASINAQDGRRGNGEIGAIRQGDSNDGFVDVDHFPGARAQQRGPIESIEATSTPNNTKTQPKKRGKLRGSEDKITNNTTAGMQKVSNKRSGESMHASNKRRTKRKVAEDKDTPEDLMPFLLTSNRRFPGKK